MGRSSHGSGGECDKACGITLATIFGSLLGIMLIMYIIYPSYLLKRFKTKLIRARNKFFVEYDKSANISFPLKHNNMQESLWIEKPTIYDEESGDRKSKPVSISGN